MGGRARKRYTLDTHRTVAPAETLARVRPHLAAMGITRVANVTGLDRIGIPVVMVTRPNSRSVAVSQGKGLSLDAARASGVMEAVESWHAERIALPVRWGSLRDLRQDAATAEVERLPRVRGGRFEETRRILWVEGRDLGTGGAAWLPYEMVHTDYTLPTAPGHGCFPCSTNGLASGTDLLEATCHAICELVERDATSLWHARSAEGRQRARLRAESVDDPVCREALDRLAGAGLATGIWETTSDIGVAAFHAVVGEGGDRPGHIGIGDGCHPHRGIALLRALTEAVQTRMTYISGARDDMTPGEFSGPAIERKSRYVRDLIRGAEPERDFADCPHRESGSFEDDLSWLLGRLASVGCGQVLTVDLTRREIGLPVVRAVVPGLEAPHDDETYLAGPRALAAAAAA